MRATFKLMNAYFWKTIYGPIISFLFPVILLGILGNIFRIEYVYPGIIAMSMFFMGVISLPLSILELKQSSLFKYIGSSPVNPIKFTLVVIGFYIFVAILSSLVTLLATMTIFWKNVFPDAGFRSGILGGIFSHPGAISFYIASGIHLLLVISLGLFISTISKTPQQALTIGIIILIPSIFLSGMILSVDIIAQSPVFNWLSRTNIFRYSTANIVISSTPKNQIGDMFQTLTNGQKELLFGNSYIKDSTSKDFGKVIFKNLRSIENLTNTKDFNIKSLNDLKKSIEWGGDNIYIVRHMNDPELFKLTFLKALNSNSIKSDNNIFNWADGWSVRRIPRIDSVKDFITEYFNKFGDGNDNFKKLKPIAEKILKKDFSWLEIFLKQTNQLYTTIERVMNIFLPIIISSGMIWYISKNFKWSNK